MSHFELSIEDAELERLLSEIYRKYGFDFREYTRASLKRRINRIIETGHYSSVAMLQYKVLNDEASFEKFVEDITVNVTEMFRDPDFYNYLRENIFPMLATYPFIRIWHAGCATGEEVYSMAILLREAGLLERTLLYATDINPAVLETASRGIFPIMAMKLYSANYITAGGTDSLSNYYTAHYDKALFDETLSKRMVFAVHNLATDASFNEFNLILCRNVLIYFTRQLQDKALALFAESLVTGGFLALGSKESVAYSASRGQFTIESREDKIWRKTKPAKPLY